MRKNYKEERIATLRNLIAKEVDRNAPDLEPAIKTMLIDAIVLQTHEQRRAVRIVNQLFASQDTFPSLETPALIEQHVSDIGSHLPMQAPTHGKYGTAINNGKNFESSSRGGYAMD